MKARGLSRIVQPLLLLVLAVESVLWIGAQVVTLSYGFVAFCTFAGTDATGQFHYSPWVSYCEYSGDDYDGLLSEVRSRSLLAEEQPVSAWVEDEVVDGGLRVVSWVAMLGRWAGFLRWLSPSLLVAILVTSLTYLAVRRTLLEW